MPDLFMSDPARMKKGTASSGKLSRLIVSLSGMIKIGSVPLSTMNPKAARSMENETGHLRSRSTKNNMKKMASITILLCAA
jgi:hypothetical protein